MCGIVGINGDYKVSSSLIAGLKKLEYRGYDSAGIACVDNNIIRTLKKEGKVSALEDLLATQVCDGYIGIAHTRWATHGKANTANAHPHSTDKVSIVHNGIIENFETIKNSLRSEGVSFESDTDSEVILRLIDKYLRAGDAPLEATTKAVAKLQGAFAILAIFADYPETMICCRHGAPIAVSKNDNATYAGSDAYSLASFTDQITYLENGDIALLTKDSINIFDQKGNRQHRNSVKIDRSSVTQDKGCFEHYMLKEIYEQPIIAQKTLEQHINTSLPSIITADIEHIYIIACGTSYFSGMVSKYWFEEILQIQTNVEIASEFRCRTLPLPKNSLTIFISQSGETADTIASMQLAKNFGCKTLCITNTEQSTMTRLADATLLIYAGIEIGVASTKAFTAQLITLAIFCLQFAHLKNTIKDLTTHYNQLLEIPGRIAQALTHEDAIKIIAQELSGSQSVIFIGRGTYYPIALEGALKLKEISYIHAEGVAAGELKHGSIALIDEDVFVVSIAPYNHLFEKSMSNILSVAARKGKIVLLSDNQGYESLRDVCHSHITLSSCPDFITPIIYAIPLQLLAYHTAHAKNLEIDQPRNLAKSVTVE